MLYYFQVYSKVIQLYIYMGVKVLVPRHVQLFAVPWTAAR